MEKTEQGLEEAEMEGAFAQQKNMEAAMSLLCVRQLLGASPTHFSGPFVLVCFCLGSRKAKYCPSVCSQGGPSGDFVLDDKYMNKILLRVSAEVLAFFLRGTAMVYINLSPFSFLPAFNMNMMAGSAVAIL